VGRALDWRGGRSEPWLGIPDDMTDIGGGIIGKIDRPTHPLNGILGSTFLLNSRVHNSPLYIKGTHLESPLKPNHGCC
jgi:hypothetical protein